MLICSYARVSRADSAEHLRKSAVCLARGHRNVLTAQTVQHVRICIPAGSGKPEGAVRAPEAREDGFSSGPPRFDSCTTDSTHAAQRSFTSQCFMQTTPAERTKSQGAAIYGLCAG